MLELNNDKEKNITFEISLAGISPRELNGYFRITVDGVEYGFPATISEKAISVDIPGLKSVINRPLREHEKFTSKLEVFGNGTYLNPWSGEVKVINAIVLEAKIIEPKTIINANSEHPKTITKYPVVPAKEKGKVKILESKKIVKKPIEKQIIQEVDHTNITKQHLYKYMEKNGTTNPDVQKIIMEKCISKVGDTDMKKLFTEIFKYYNFKRK